MRWAGHVAYIGWMKSMHRTLVKLKRTIKLGYIIVLVRIIVKLILNKSGVGVWTGFIRLRITTVAVSCEHGSEASGYIKGG
jgi:hypothetical protein